MALVPVFAHAGHWAVDLLYLLPVLVLVAGALNGRRQARRRARDGAKRPDAKARRAE